MMNKDLYMLPTIEDICIEKIVSVRLEDTIGDAIKKMSQENVRSIIVISNISSVLSDHYIITTNDAIEYKIQNISMDTKLSDIVLNRVPTIDANISILEIINQESIKNEYMLVVKEDKLVGFISKTDIINNIDPKILMQKQTIGNLILQYSAVSIYEDEATVNAIKIMKYKHVDSVIIKNAKNKPIGIFTTKDFLNIMETFADLTLPVKKFMTSPLQTLPFDVRIFEALEFIKEKHFKRLVVTDFDGTIKGVITQTELLRLVNNRWMKLIQEQGNKLSKKHQELLEKTASLEEKASTDFLTQLVNRRKFDSIMKYEIEQIKRYKNRDLSIVLLDIDGFKYINDTYGHDIGDIILQEIANILKITSRQSDVVCRWGGEEFAISLPETNLEQAMIVAQKIRITIENNIFVKNLRITCSFGVSHFHSNDDYTSLFKRADESLYKAKNTGKNKVVIEYT